MARRKRRYRRNEERLYVSDKDHGLIVAAREYIGDALDSLEKTSRPGYGVSPGDKRKIASIVKKLLKVYNEIDRFERTELGR